MDVYLERGAKKVFAAAAHWPGWARSGATDEAALAALVDYGERYRQSMGRAAHDLRLPESVNELDIVEHMTGNATTDFGAPGAIPRLDLVPVDEVTLERLVRLAKAAWKAFDRSADSAEGAELAPAGPRGGGRSLSKIREHVADAERSYLAALGGSYDMNKTWQENQEAFVSALRARGHGELPDVGPRGGKRWPAAYAVRRSAWHALDHAWEIEDRVER